MTHERVLSPRYLFWLACSVAAGGACSGNVVGLSGGSGGAPSSSSASAGGSHTGSTGTVSSTGSMSTSTGVSSTGFMSTGSGMSSTGSMSTSTGVSSTGSMSTSTGSTSTSTGVSSTGSGTSSTSSSGGCALSCSYDLHSIVDCNNVVVQTCTGGNGCDLASVTCINACNAAGGSKLSVGCDYYATDMDQYSDGLCFAAFVANTWNTPAHIIVEYAGTALPVANFTRVSAGSGPSMVLNPYDPVAGLPPGEAAVLFLAGTGSSMVPCPIMTPAVPSGAAIIGASGIGSSFHITTDVPVVAYEMNPYGGGGAAVTGASLLLPTSVWDTNYLAVTAAPYDIYPPSMNVIAVEDGTQVTMLPKVAIAGGGALPPGAANVPYVFNLDHGQQAQFSQTADLTGSILQSNKPIGFMAGQPCMRIPLGVTFCDHGEQMVPPIRALGSEYVAVGPRARVSGDATIWHLVGVVDGTLLTYSSSVGGPLTVVSGQAVDFISATPFVVKSQDAAHPFMLFAYMSGSQWTQLSDKTGYGDPDFVLDVPPQQYNENFVFFADPSYPETNLVIVRARDTQNQFDDVILDCVGTLAGWQAVGNYEWTRADLDTGNFQNVGSCTTGRHQITSTAPFGLWVWGWGTPLTSSFTANVSYGYPAGMNVRSINTVVMPPVP